MKRGTKPKMKGVRAWALRFINTQVGFNIHKIYESKKDALFAAAEHKYLYKLNSPSDALVEVEIHPIPPKQKRTRKP